jgi:geranylgeranyl diphosphate synthase type II
MLSKELHIQIERELASFSQSFHHNSLYDPIHYLLSLGGKRIRPALVVMANEACGGNRSSAFPAALAVELFHNFTLMHDDIMDNAPSRRGHPTVHEKWNANKAILSGDAMFAMAYTLLSKCDEDLIPNLLELFNKTALEVCEGQELDMNFEVRNDVSVEEYIEMIRLKTSVLVAAALGMGAICARANAAVVNALYSFGENLGIAFQLLDDWLDTFGEQERIGKIRGGDILADKKTFLIIRTRQIADTASLAKLDAYSGNKSANPEEKITFITSLIRQNQVDQELLALADSYRTKALTSLDMCSIPNEAKALFTSFANDLMARDH